MLIKFKRGWLDCDFDSMATQVFVESELVLTLSNNPKFGKYDTQIALLDEFFTNGWSDERFDDFPGQVQLLRWLMKLEVPDNPTSLPRSKFNRLLERFPLLPDDTSPPLDVFLERPLLPMELAEDGDEEKGTEDGFVAPTPDDRRKH